MVKKLGLAGGIFFGFLSVSNLHLYYAKPLVPEMDMIRNASVYIQKYQGQTPGEALEYAQKTVRLAAKENPGIQKLSELEKEIFRAKEELRISQNNTSYHKTLKSLGKKMKDLSDENSRNSNDLWAGYLTAMASLAFLRYALTEKNR